MSKVIQMKPYVDKYYTEICGYLWHTVEDVKRMRQLRGIRNKYKRIPKWEEQLRNDLKAILDE